MGFRFNVNATNTRATIVSGAPTASRDMLVSTPDRHLVLFGTETTIGDYFYSRRYVYKILFSRGYN